MNTCTAKPHPCVSAIVTAVCCMSINGARHVPLPRRPPSRYRADRLVPLIMDDNLDLSAWNKKWICDQFIPLFERVRRKARFNHDRAGKYRRGLIFFGVVVSAMILLENTTYVQQSPAAVWVMFIATIVMSLINNYFTAIMTDLKLVERAALFLRAAVHLHSIVNTFLTLTQRYAVFTSHDKAFRTFVRDVENVRVMLSTEEVTFMQSSKQPQPRPSDKIVAHRQTWKHLFDPLSMREGLAMRELAPPERDADQKPRGEPGDLESASLLLHLRDTDGTSEHSLSSGVL